MTLAPGRYLVDKDLSRRLERTEGRSGADFVDAHARREPAVGAIWQEVQGTFAMFDGVGSPVTQTFALGLSGAVAPTLMDTLEEFFWSRGAGVFHEVSPLADDSALQQLTGRGYRPVEFTSVLFQELRSWRPDPNAVANAVAVRPITPADASTWVNTSVEGWSEFSEYAAVMRDLAEIGVACRGSHNFLATIRDQPVATGSLSIVEDIALLAGASTIPSARRQGAQLALLDARLTHARDTGCDIAMMCARPGSASQRNAERHGFRIAYTRIKWEGSPRGGANQSG
jgi:hypothetical protein